MATQLPPNISGWLWLPLHLRLQLQLQMQLQLQPQLQADPGGHRGPAPWRRQVATQLLPNMSGWLWLTLHLQLQLQLQMQLQLQLQLQLQRSCRRSSPWRTPVDKKKNQNA